MFIFVQLFYFSGAPLLLNGLHVKLEFRILIFFIEIICEWDLLCGNGRDGSVSFEVTCGKNSNAAQHTE